jgi:hypothetical protein
MVVKYTKWPYNIPTSSIARPSKIYPNWDFDLKIYHLATLTERTDYFVSDMRRLLTLIHLMLGDRGLVGQVTWES